MSSDVVIKAESISKVFKMYESPQDRLKQFFMGDKKKAYEEHLALDNVSIVIEKGQTVGIIGANGSGKSTFLQIIAGILKPTFGRVEVKGRISALLELGSGFNPEFTGRENVILNASIMGLSKNEIESKMQSIIDFSEISEFIDQPVKTYSSGMFVRLAFSCAVHVEPEILIVDEALSVGDLQFQLKCIEKMKDFKKAGKTILFVSHDTYSIKNFCDKAIWMMNGQIHQVGDVNLVSNSYEEFMKQRAYQQDLPVSKERKEERYLSIDNIVFMNNKKEEVKQFNYAEDIEIVVGYTLYKSVEGVVGGIALYDNMNQYICGLNTKLDGIKLESKPGQYRLHLSYTNMSLLPGIYYVDVGFFESSGIGRLDYIKKLDSFRISSDRYFAEGVVRLDHKWDCEELL